MVSSAPGWLGFSLLIYVALFVVGIYITILIIKFLQKGIKVFDLYLKNNKL